jgi:hypothetical protein
LEQREDRAVYVKGVPHAWQNGPFEILVANFGEVDKVPCLISLGSEHTFRWAIMATAEEADNLLNGMHGMRFEGEYLTTSMATPPGRTIHLLAPLTQAPAQPPPTPHTHLIIALEQALEHFLEQQLSTVTHLQLQAPIHRRRQRKTYHPSLSTQHPLLEQNQWQFQRSLPRLP